MAKPKQKRKPVWTSEELCCLRANFGKLPVLEISKLLPIRTENSIYRKARELGLKPINRQVRQAPPLPARHRWECKNGDRIRVTLPGLTGLKGTVPPGWESNRRVYTGRVVRVCEQHVSVLLDQECGGWAESINYGTWLAGEAIIELLGKGQIA